MGAAATQERKKDTVSLVLPRTVFQLLSTSIVTMCKTQVNVKLPRVKAFNDWGK